MLITFDLSVEFKDSKVSRTKLSDVEPCVLLTISKEGDDDSNGTCIAKRRNTPNSTLKPFSISILTSHWILTPFVKESIEPNNVFLNGGVHTLIWLDEDGNGARTPEGIFMETFDCASDETVVECNDSDG